MVCGEVFRARHGRVHRTIDPFVVVPHAVEGSTSTEHPHGLHPHSAHTYPGECASAMTPRHCMGAGEGDSTNTHPHTHVHARSIWVWAQITTRRLGENGRVGKAMQIEGLRTPKISNYSRKALCCRPFRMALVVTEAVEGSGGSQ